MQLCEMGTLLNGHWFREIRKLSKDGHQTSILTTHPTLLMGEIAVRMFARWTQENYFKYMIANFDFDKMIEYGTEPVNQKRTIPNQEYKALTYKIKKQKEKLSRLEARIFKQAGDVKALDLDHLAKYITKNADLIDQITSRKQEIEALKVKRKGVPSRITIAQMPEEYRYNKLKQEGKKLKNAVVMLAYRSESALYNIMYEFYKDNDKEGRMILKEIFTSDADMIPDYANKKLVIRLHSLSTPRANQAVKELCSVLNETETFFPLTNLMLVYETVAN